MTRVKICGVTCAEDAAVAVAAGADAIGVVCHADAPRAVGKDVARQISAEVPPFVTMVLLFVDPPDAVVEESLSAVPHAWLQFHGAEGPEQCQSYGVPYIKSCKPAAPGDVQGKMESHPKARALLVDGGAGSGTGFDWSLVPPKKERGLPVVIAGGLDSSNVAQAVVATEPDAVDVSSGVCVDGDPLRKDPAKVAAFIKAARDANG